MTEVWKEIQNTNGKYLVSNKGNVCGPKGLLNKFLKGQYLTVGIRYGEQGKRYAKSIHVHRLVAIAFIPNPNNKLQVNHIDGNKFNNSVDNLEWATAYENQKHRIEILGKGSSGTNNPMYGKSGANGPKFKDYILQIDKDGNTVNRFESALEAARYINGFTKHNIGAGKIAECCRHIRKTYHGYQWIFEREHKS
ncbi:MAG: HNH endonuclease [Phascolarctobacterium sp.]|jgi:hypothetical protein|nr:HNH endonuclease [Phascolarctobacterium sp.]